MSAVHIGEDEAIIVREQTGLVKVDLPRVTVSDCYVDPGALVNNPVLYLTPQECIRLAGALLDGAVEAL